MGPSLKTTLDVVAPMMAISAGTLFDALRGSLTRQASDDRIAWWASQVVRRTGMDLRVEGREHLEGAETFVVMSNHQSHIDIPVLFAAVSPRLRMVTKKELFRVPIWGKAMRESGFIEIDRQNRDRAIESLRVAKETLRSGVHVWIAPEGTRSRDGVMLPFKKGGFMTALDSDTRILPVGVSGTRDVLPKGRAKARAGQRIAVVIGAPIDVSGKDRDGLMVETRSAIEALVKRADALRAA
jgi:1-acyl-sn-glycerol-3-phosphate acyltransferase